MDMKRFFLYAIVIAALALAGCGGGGGGGGMTGTPTTPTEPTPPPGPTPEEMALEDAQEAAMAAYMMAMGYVNSAKDYVAMGNAMKYADMAKGASDMAAAATTSAMAEEYQMKAEMYRDQAKDAAMMRGLGITNLANMIVNQQQIDNAELEGRDPVKPRSNATRVEDAMEMAAERMAEPSEVTVADSGMGSVAQGSSATDAAARAASASVTLDAEDLPGLRITITRADVALTAGEEPKKLKSRGDWPGTERVNTVAATDANQAGMTYANAYTDIQPPTQAYDGDTDTTAFLVRSDTVPRGSVVVAGDVPNDGSNFAVTLNVNPTDNVAPIMGQFRCITAPCSISVDDSGQIVANTGYTFHESTGVFMQDSDYLAWGVWLTVPGAVKATGEFQDGDAGDATTGVFASGNNVFVVNAALKGKATYNGVATGLYSAGGMVEAFDADVMLEANFGGTVGADNPANTTADDGTLLGAVTGTVSNINAGGMAVDGSLMLLRAPVLSGTRGTPSTTAGDPSTAGFIGDTDGILGGMTYRGEWGGQFYGPNKATGDAIQNEFPTTSAGTFGAAAENGASILGAFGSWKAD